MPVEFFNPTKVITAVDDSCWEIQQSTVTESDQRDEESKANGDEYASAHSHAIETVSETYVCKIATGNLVLPAVGCPKTTGRWHIDTLTVSYKTNSAATLQVTAHRHGGVNHDWTRTVSPSITLPARVLGIPATVIGLADSGVGIRSLTYSLTIKHFDEFDEDGEHHASGSCDATETLAADLTTATEVTVNGFERIERTGEHSNTTAKATNVKLVKHIVAADTVTNDET